MLKNTFRAIAEKFGVSQKEAILYLVLSAIGWSYFAYQYLYETGLGIAVPKYAGY